MNSRALSGVLLLGAAALLGYAWTHGMVAGALAAIAETIGGKPLDAPAMPAYQASSASSPGRYVS